MKMEIDFNKIPGFSQLFIDYVNDFNSVKDFYNFRYDNIDSYKSAINRRESLYEVDRNEISFILMSQNKFFNSSEKSFANIEKLKNKNTFAVVTGQQIGLFTGNYYTVIKALNTVQLADFLSEKFPEYNFVPIFWLECEDHDFLEINNINILNVNNLPVNLKYFENGQEKEKYTQPTGTIVTDKKITEFVESLFENLIGTEFSAGIKNFALRAYKSGLDLKTSFGRFINYILKDKGLILLDPSDRDIKKLLVPIFRKELQTYPKSCEIMIDTSVMLEQRYEPQIKPKPLNLFYIYKNNRYLLEPLPERIVMLKNTRQKFTQEELIEQLGLQPEKFSPNVTLRPICQDYLLPTIAYVGGPSEISYFAQLKGIYSFYGNEMPVIFPRTSVTIIENRIKNFLLKFEIDIEELYDEYTVTNKLMNQINEINIEDLFSGFTGTFNGLIYETGESIRNIDKNIETLFRNKALKFIESLDSVKKKLIESRNKQNENKILKLKTIISGVYPEKILQERYINIVYFLNKYGNDIIEILFKNINIFSKNHQNILLNNED